jgi:hypothetical protein
MYINSLIDLTRITSTGSKSMIVDELNDFADYGRLYFNIILIYKFKFILDTPRFNSNAWHIFELDPCDGHGRVCLVYNSVCN